MSERGRTYLQSCLLLLIAERPDHGYDLVTRLAPFGFDADAACTYRALRALERDGLVSSSWRPSATGPARRTYRLTLGGRAWLAESGEALRRNRDHLTCFLQRLDAVCGAQPGAGGAVLHPTAARRI